LRAAQKRQADNSANYAPAFNHGQLALDFERSAEAASASRDQVGSHLTLLDRTLLTLCGFFPRPCLWSAQAAAAQRRTHSLVESLWNRPHVFSARVAELRELLEATLVWKPGRFLQLWLKMLPVEPAYAEVDFFQCTHGKGHENTEWGYETTPVWRLNRRGTKPQPAIVPRSEAEGRRKHAGESQHALRIWFFACGTRWSPCCAARTK